MALVVALEELDVEEAVLVRLAVDADESTTAPAGTVRVAKYSTPFSPQSAQNRPNVRRSIGVRTSRTPASEIAVNDAAEITVTVSSAIPNSSGTTRPVRTGREPDGDCAPAPAAARSAAVAKPMRRRGFRAEGIRFSS